jgi:hypothetical protein
MDDQHPFIEGSNSSMAGLGSSVGLARVIGQNSEGAIEMGTINRVRAWEALPRTKD